MLNKGTFKITMNKNIVLVVMDTARAPDTKYVYNKVSNSSIERLVEEGTEFTNAFTNAPWTLPSHASLFTGTYTSKHGTHAGHKFLDDSFPTLAELLSAEGYQTAGVTNNAWVTNEFGLANGFNDFFKAWQYIQAETDFGEIKLTTHGVDLVKRSVKGLLNGEIIANLMNTVYGQFIYRRKDYGAKRTNSIVRSWIEDRDSNKPFFLFINYLEPHLDYQPPKEFAEPFLPSDATYKEAMKVPQKPWDYVSGALEMSDRDFELLRSLYRAEIAYLDAQIGDLRQVLYEKKEWQDTIFIIVGDHGENIGEHDLMDHQYSLHDTLLHVPLFFSGGAFDGVGKSDRLVQTVDLFPTILDIAGVDIPSHSQGLSFHPSSTDPPRERIFAEYRCPQPTIERLSKETDIPLEDLQQYDKKLRSVQTDEYKIVRDSNGKLEFYNLKDRETKIEDWSSEEQEVVEGLETDLKKWLSSFEQASLKDSTEMDNETKKMLEDLGYLQ
ncbi:hypothetical protein Harman_33370 [Haloarcula mannanilytica]|uniref:Sulfatase N-terminal domain-containing protein n=1 Tax=Haloarcula mannanilytica TaxID=2509225 RepID=A0A4C2EM71_9EURY|nr:sulfatase [Haloarcula mannanilytica]GCF15402.1 hypothetical protein Harman_33370 [Haloarcula mannanilytica]